ncbi:MAG: threonylcarbamoyl-AMP synthase [Gemmatimonadetes bacterium]|nr:threonylcarbamoyl-AMP synthase [Gemmatimonadota bacterium]
MDPARPSGEVLAEAGKIIRRGGLVAFPTETVYGLGGNALDDAAVRRIFAAKGRPSFNPLIAHVIDVDAARALAVRWPAVAERLAERFWPGPLTLVVAKRVDVPDVLTAGLPAVAIRAPAHPVARGLIEAAGVPVAAPSANRFTELSPTTALHVQKALGGRVDLILDGGPTSVGIESTVIDLSGPVPTLLRHGSIARSDIEAVAGELALGAEGEGEEPRLGPGMVKRHYSPRARLHLFARGDVPALTTTAAEATSRGLRVGAVLRLAPDPPGARVVRMPTDPAGYARVLYAALHQMDDLGCDLILMDAVPDAPEWAGIRDRLRRAADQP